MQELNDERKQLEDEKNNMELLGEDGNSGASNDGFPISGASQRQLNLRKSQRQKEIDKAAAATNTGKGGKFIYVSKRLCAYACGCAF